MLGLITLRRCRGPAAVLGMWTYNVWDAKGELIDCGVRTDREECVEAIQEQWVDCARAA